MADDPDFVPYSQRPEWSDVTPLEAAPGEEGNVVAVKYSKHDRQLLGYFRAVVAKVRTWWRCSWGTQRGGGG
jgi:hypothetical protein